MRKAQVYFLGFDSGLEFLLLLPKQKGMDPISIKSILTSLRYSYDPAGRINRIILKEFADLNSTLPVFI